MNRYKGLAVSAAKCLWFLAKKLYQGAKEFQIVLAAVLTAVVVMNSWSVTYNQNSKLDREARSRNIRVQYLIEAYRRLESAASRTLRSDKDLQDYGHNVENAIGDIQLFGTKEQVELATGVVASMRGPGATADLKPLLKALRRNLREELQLPAVEGDPVQLRIIPKPVGEERAPTP